MAEYLTPIPELSLAASLQAYENSTVSAESLQSFLEKQKGMRVTLKLRSVQELTETVKDAMGKPMVLRDWRGRRMLMP